MSNQLLKGKKGIIFGALNDQSIAWKVAERAVDYDYYNRTIDISAISFHWH